MTINLKATLPPKVNRTYNIDAFLEDEFIQKDSCSIFAIPWDDGVIFTTKRLENVQGCVVCLARRLVASVFHKKAKINKVDSIFIIKEMMKIFLSIEQIL